MKKIVVTGVECSGKTTLSKALANKLDFSYVPEYARVYLQNLDRPYEIYDLHNIALKQFQSERELLSKPGKGIICDTGLLVIKIWSQVKYGDVHPMIRALLQFSLPDLYILPHYDIPYEEDPLRESPEIRPELFKIYKSELEKSGVDYVIVHGNMEDRMNQLDSTLDSLLNKNT